MLKRKKIVWERDGGLDWTGVHGDEMKGMERETACECMRDRGKREGNVCGRESVCATLTLIRESGSTQHDQ